MSIADRILVTQPSLPDLKEFYSYLDQIWQSKWLTNGGQFHQELEAKMAQYLGVDYISLYSNGTLALIAAIQALNLTGEVITTPYSFVATAHSIWWNKLTPVFVDVDPISGNLDPEKIEEAITEKTSAILPVHVYGTPCDHEKIKAIADKHNLRIIYDAAHAFGVKQNDTSVLNYGDLSILSFHATKVYSTIEGGAIICHSAEMKRHIDHLKNFGFEGELNVVEPGINAKMNELQAAFGLLQLQMVDNNIEKRKRISQIYKSELSGIEGIRCMPDFPAVKYNYSYFPVFFNDKKCGLTRDEIYYKLQENNIFGRRYFYPLITAFYPYRGLLRFPLEQAERIAGEVICLPIYPDLEVDNVYRICKLLKGFIV